MEAVLEKVGEFPQGAVLSLKIGGAKKQAPVTKIGQLFRFAVPAYPASIQAEVFVPVGPAQEVTASPGEDTVLLDFGAGQEVSLRLRHNAPETNSEVDLGLAAEPKGSTQDKLQVAQKAAAYLEEHDLVKTFQDILHGLLVSRPVDPHAFVEERLALAKKPPPSAAAESMSGRSSRIMSKDPGTRKANLRMAQRDDRHVAQNKVDTLLMTLQSAQDNVALVLPFLPEEMQRSVESAELAEDCKAQFQKLDINQAGRLNPTDMLPLIQRLTKTSATDVNETQCRRFVDMFDSDGDGLISIEDFIYLVQFVMVASFLESEDGRKAIEMAKVEENVFNDFLSMIEADKERLWTIIPFLPSWLVDHVTSEEFHSACVDNFVTLDVDKSGSLEPAELIPVIETLSEAHPLAIDSEKCRRFTALFDTQGNGFIMREEFIEFAQFITVMNFLSNTAEGQQLRQRANHAESTKKTLNYIATIEKDPSKVAEVMHDVPKSLVAELESAVFKESCQKSFASLNSSVDHDVARLTVEEVAPVLGNLCERFTFNMTEDDIRRYVALFDLKPEFAEADFVNLAKFVVVLGCLYDKKSSEEKLEVDLKVGQENIDKVLVALREGVEQISDIIPFLPRDFLDELFTDDFASQCANDFKELDKNSSGLLEPSELMPIIMNMVEAHHLCLTENHARQFVDIFDAEGNGAITEGEFANFVRFMMIMAFMQTEDGKQMQERMELVQGQESVNGLLRLLEQDRKAIHKVVPLLPSDIYNELTSDDFIVSCHDKFLALDKDQTGALRPHELYPVVAELSATQICVVTEEQCKRFTAIFDLYGDGVLRPEEFLDFSRFLCIMSYLHTDAGKIAAKDALTIFEESKKIEDLLDAMQSGRKEIHKVIPYLPDWLREDVLSHRFTLECLNYFKDLDKDGNGTLDAEELFPMVLTLSEAHEQSLDVEQCRRFAAIFDDAKNGAITQDEFVEFSRFLIVMGYLHSQEGKQVLESAWASGKRQPEQSSGPLEKAEERVGSFSNALIASTVKAATPSKVGPLESPSSPAHLAVDCEFYQKKSERLESENEQLRNRLQEMEVALRRLEQQMEEQGRSLRHAEVALKASGAQR